MQVGDLLGGRYKLKKVLGRGSFGVVWEAEEWVSGQSIGWVAVKALMVEASVKEMAMLSRFDHPNILRYRATLAEGGQLFVVTDLADGGSLDRYKQAWPQGAPEAEVAGLVLGTARALEYLHGQRVVHRDVKPANILLLDGVVKLGDVGLAKAVEGSLTKHSGGESPAYAAPEMFDGEVGFKSDVYGLGVTAYELLTARLPFEARTPMAMMKAHATQAVRFPAGVSAGMRRLLAGCLEKETGPRWSAAQVAGYIESEGLTGQVDPRVATAQVKTARLMREVAAAQVEIARQQRELEGAKAEINRLHRELEAAQAEIARLRRELEEAKRRAVPVAPPPAVLPPPWRFTSAAPSAQVRTEYEGRQFVITEAGRFVMGSPGSEEGRWDDEGPQHGVRITAGYLMQTTPVTQAQWRAVMGNNPSHFQGTERPVEQVSWHDAVAYCNALSRRYGLEEAYVLNGAKGTAGAGTYTAAVSWKGLKCPGFRLPTEAEWEYAARAGSQRARPGLLDEVAWYDGNSGSQTHPVGQKKANAWGLHDMLGNVWEWAWDWFSAFPAGEQVDPTGPSAGLYRVIRGGSCYDSPQSARVAYRFLVDTTYRFVNLGFRVVRSLP